MSDPTIEVEQVGDVTMARIAGDIDLANASSVGASLSAAPASACGLAVDLTGVTYLDSAGIAELFRLSTQLASRGGLAVVVPDGSPLRRLFKITQFEEAALVCLTEQDAIAALGAGNAKA